LERIADQLHDEMDRQEERAAPRPSFAARPSAPINLAARLSRRANLARHAARLVPMATAAAVLVGVGVWLGYRPDGDRTGNPTPALPGHARPVKERPAPNPLPPDGPEFSVP
jgi:hypothetical protein